MEQETMIELLMDKIKNPRKYEHTVLPQLPGLYDCILKLREYGITHRLNASLKPLYDRIEREHNLPAIETIYKPKTILK